MIWLNTQERRLKRVIQYIAAFFSPAVHYPMCWLRGYLDLTLDTQEGCLRNTKVYLLRILQLSGVKSWMLPNVVLPSSQFPDLDWFPLWGLRRIPRRTPRLLPRLPRRRREPAARPRRRSGPRARPGRSSVWSRTFLNPKLLIIHCRDKLNNLVLFDKNTYDKLYKEVPTYKLITPSIVSERLKVCCLKLLIFPAKLDSDAKLPTLFDTLWCKHSKYPWIDAEYFTVSNFSL